jgi:hypothetical protein
MAGLIVAQTLYPVIPVVVDKDRRDPGVFTTRESDRDSGKKNVSYFRVGTVPDPALDGLDIVDLTEPRYEYRTTVSRDSVVIYRSGWSEDQTPADTDGWTIEPDDMVTTQRRQIYYSVPVNMDADGYPVT